MSDDLVEQLRDDSGREACKRDIPDFPCAALCPCALELRILADADELDRLRAENERMLDALALIDQQLDSHGFSVDGPMRRLILHTRAALQTKGDEE